ncbi:rhomboid family intramembrane serine protease [Corynebacterium aquilae]|uniref:rhomboid family intramembrane serine protease n=1 Tax=Corynebacterium aquilae TaxID=203263 RepID=UPI0014741D82|nr:rhomboid family intramembrane serine protease [Corynebacterium aquilae]
MTFQQPPLPTTPTRPQNHKPQRLKSAAAIAVGYLVVLWVIYGLEILFGQSALKFGVHPLDVTSLPDIFTAPLLHGSLQHLISNSIPGALFAFLIALSGKRAFFQSTLIIAIISGLGVWLIGGPNSVHIGASGVIYGWLAYLVVRGWFNSNLLQLILGVVLGLSYTGWIWALLPTTPGVSWQYHLCGAIGGIIAARLMGTRPKKTTPDTTTPAQPAW